MLVFAASGMGMLLAMMPQASGAPFAPQAAPTPTPTPTPTLATGVSGLYRNTTEGFSIVLPQGWSADETGGRAPIVIARTPEEAPFLFAPVYVFRLLDSETAEEWVTGEVTSFGFNTILSEGAVRLGTETSGYEIAFNWFTDSELEVRERWTSVVRGTQAFLVRVQTIALTEGPLAGPIDAFTTSFTLEAPAPFGASRDDSLFLLGGTFLTLDPALYRGGPDGPPGAIFSGLVRLDRSLDVVPDLAERWTVSADGTVYTFYLRPGAVFHDGRSVTASDVKYSWERAADPAFESPTVRTYLGDIVGVDDVLSGESPEVMGIRVVDDLTLEVTIDAPKRYFLQKLVYPTAYIVDRTNVESGPDWTDAPNGTGPFKLKVWEKDDLLVLERNDQYYGGAPELRHIVYRLFAGQPVTLYELGEIDIASVGVSNLDRVQDVASPLNADLSVSTDFCTSYVGFNVGMPPFDDPLVRQAFSLAIDVDTILAVSLQGAVDRASGILPPGIPGFDPSLSPPPFDPDEALALLTQSRYGGAEHLPPIVSFTHDDAIHWMWEEYLGVEVEAVSLPERQDLFDRLDADELPVIASGWCADYPDPQNFLEVLFGGDRDQNQLAYANARVDGLLERAGVEQDAATRASLYQEIERLILDDWVILPLWHGRSYQLVRPYVKGYELTPIGIPIFQDVSIER